MNHWHRVQSGAFQQFYTRGEVQELAGVFVVLFQDAVGIYPQTLRGVDQFLRQVATRQIKAQTAG